MTGRGATRRIAFPIAALLLVYAAFEALCLLALWLLSVLHGIGYERLPLRSLEPLQQYVLHQLIEGQHAYLAHDAELGWSIRPGGESEHYHANDQGLRAPHAYALAPPPGRVRVASFGDFFTHGDDVADHETWQAQLEALDPRYEVMNFGVPSYGPDQALLRFERDGVRFRPDVVVIGFLSENIHRSVNVFRPFYRPPTGVPLAKPRFLLEGEELALIPNPMPHVEDYRALLDDPEPTLRRLGEHDYYYRLMQGRLPFDFLPSVRLASIVETRFMTSEIIRDGEYNADSEAFRLTLRLLERFHARAGQAGALAIVLVYPTATDLRRARRGETPLYRPLLRALDERGLAHLDVLDLFLTRGAGYEQKELIALHNTVLGNRLIAEGLREGLQRRELTSREAIQRRRDAGGWD